jgi:hypothetical protein
VRGEVDDDIEHGSTKNNPQKDIFQSHIQVENMYDVDVLYHIE